MSLTVKGIEERIRDTEGFSVRLLRPESRVDVRSDKRIGLRRYRFTNAAPDAMTVHKWMQQRFKKTYPEYEAEVFYRNRAVANGNAKLRTVRDSYRP